MQFNSAALVTGGAIRIGKAISVALAEAGYDIALHYNSSNIEAEKTRDEIRKSGHKCEIYQYDLDKIREIGPLFSKIYNEFPNLNLLINSASIFEESGFIETTEDIFDRHMNINFKAPFFLSQEFAKHVKSGQIINILDTTIHKTPIKHFVYQLSKKTLYEFTRMSARALAPSIRVNALAIGKTALSKEPYDGYLEEKQKSLPLAKILTTEDITDTLISLVKMNNITGQCIFIDGGEELL